MKYLIGDNKNIKELSKLIDNSFIHIVLRFYINL